MHVCNPLNYVKKIFLVIMAMVQNWLHFGYIWMWFLENTTESDYAKRANNLNSPAIENTQYEF